MYNKVISLLFLTGDDLTKAVAAELKYSARFRILDNAQPEIAQSERKKGIQDAAAANTGKDPEITGISGIIICEQETLARLAESAAAAAGESASDMPAAKAKAGYDYYLTMPRELFRSGTGPILTGEITAKLGAAGIRWCMADCRRPEAILEMLWHIALLDTDALPARYISGACGDGIAASEMYSGNPVETYLKRSGFSPMLSGYIYLTEAAELAADENECQGAITKHIYPEIADRHVKSAESIERAIRFAIESAWQSGRLEGFRPWSHGGSLVKPTNAEMIFRLGRIAKNAASGEKTA